MKRTLLLIAVLATALGAAGLERSRVKRTVLQAMEKSFDGRIEKLGGAEAFDLLGSTRGVYLEGYGAVFTSEVNLIVSPTLNPFRRTFSRDEIARIRERKMKQLPLLKQNMREGLKAMAASLDTVPANEQVVLGVSLFYYSWEDTSGLPNQILMRGERQKVLAAQADAIHTEEL